MSIIQELIAALFIVGLVFIFGFCGAFPLIVYQQWRESKSNNNNNNKS